MLKNTAVTAKSDRHLFLHYFVKFIFAINLLIYIFSFLWYPSVKPYALYNLLCIIAIVYRLALTTSAFHRMNFTIILVSYAILISDTLYDIYLNYEKGLTLSIVILIAFISTLLIDVMNKLKLKEGSK